MPPHYVSDSFKHLDEEDRDPKMRYQISTDLYDIGYPIFHKPQFRDGPGGRLMNHRLIAEALREAEVTKPDECVEDHEMGCFYIYFETEELANAWVERFNAYLKAEYDKLPHFDLSGATPKERCVVFGNARVPGSSLTVPVSSVRYLSQCSDNHVEPSFKEGIDVPEGHWMADISGAISALFAELEARTTGGPG